MSAPPDPTDRDARLATYRAKRRASRTPEPFGGRVLTGGSVFVVQKHAARRVHWDLRLELDGVLLSWAVPKGPSPAQADKRLAVRTEDHPLEYAEFEGVIPRGEYGAGAMIVWDRGRWTPVEDPHEGLEKGKLLFDLHGFKLRGRWTLVKTKQDEKSWLFIKERDSWEDPEGSTEDYPDDSIYSGLTVEEFPALDERAAALRERLREIGARERDVAAADVKLMLATNADRPFTREGWIFELKYDGYRLLAERQGGEARLRSRTGLDLTPTFPEVVRAVRGLPYEGLVLDGEVVVHDAHGRPSFGRLQRRGRILDPLQALKASSALPAMLYAFDLLAIEGFDLRPLPLLERKRVLREILPSVGPIRYADHIETRGEALFEGVVEMGLEGIVGKEADAPYRGGRSRCWVKVRTERSDDFVVVGWTDPGGSRTGFGALHLGRWEGGALRYRGSVGTGFRESHLDALSAELARAEVGECPCAPGPEVPRGRQHHWVDPAVVVEVRYREITEQGLLRHPVFVRVRDDKRPEDCRVEDAEEAAVLEGVAELDEAAAPIEAAPAGNGATAGGASAPGAPEETAPAAGVPSGGGPSSPRERLVLSNLDKVFWPEDGYTKGDLLEYHRRIAPWMLPYLEDRPLVMTRYPDGIEGKSFFQKDAPPHAPEWIRTVELWSEGSERTLSYFVADGLEALLYVVNLGTIPIHVWSSCVRALERPDWCILDLDPKEAPFEHVVEVALRVRAVCEEIGLPCYAKTSGSSGIHVLIPLGGRLDHEQSRTLAQLLGRVVVTEVPKLATLIRNPARRGGKVYVDTVQNGQGRLIAAPFTVRPLPGAPVSTPLAWDEVVPGLRIRDHTIATVPERMERLGRDPLAPVLEESPDLLGALQALAGRFG